MTNTEAPRISYVHAGRSPLPRAPRTVVLQQGQKVVLTGPRAGTVVARPRISYVKAPRT